MKTWRQTDPVPATGQLLQQEPEVGRCVIGHPGEVVAGCQQTHPIRRPRQCSLPHLPPDVSGSSTRGGVEDVLQGSPRHQQDTIHQSAEVRVSHHKKKLQQDKERPLLQNHPPPGSCPFMDNHLFGGRL